MDNIEISLTVEDLDIELAILRHNVKTDEYYSRSIDFDIIESVSSRIPLTLKVTYDAKENGYYYGISWRGTDMVYASRYLGELIAKFRSMINECKEKQ